MAVILPMNRSAFDSFPSMTSCRECGSANSLISDYAAGDLICIKCGCVAARGVQDEGSDCRLYSDGKEVKGAQHFVTFGELGSAEIKCSRPDMFCPPGSRQKATKSEKQLLRSLQSIQSMCSRLFLQKIVVDTAHSILRSAMSISFLAATLRKRRRAFLTATIVIASHKHSCARSLKEVSFGTDTHWKSVAKCYSRIVEKLDLKIRPQRPHEYVTRFCCLLRMSQAISHVAAQLASSYAKSESPLSAQPTAIAAAAILFISSMSKQRKEARQVAAIAFIPERLLLRLYADMYGKLNDLFTTEDLINLQEHGLDMRKLLRPNVAATWKMSNAHTASKKRRRVHTVSIPASDEPQEKSSRSNK